MTEQSPPATGDPTPPATGDTPAPATGDQPDTDWAAEAERWKAQARKNEDRAKTNATAAKELEQLRRQAMTDQERAVAEAVDKAKAEINVEARNRFGARLVTAEIRAAAAGRLTPDQLDALTARLDVSGFITDDGDINASAVAEFVEGIAPAALTGPPGFPDLGQGARGAVPLPLNGDPLERDLKSKLGIR